jgi:chromosome segregation ATPase
MSVDRSFIERLAAAQQDTKAKQVAIGLETGGRGDDSGGMDDLPARVTRVESRLEAVDSTLVRVDARLTIIEDRMGRLEGGLTRIEGRMDRLETRMDGIDGRLRSVEQSLAEISGKLTTLTALTSQMVGKLPSWWKIPAVIASTILLLAGLFGFGLRLAKLGYF